MPFIRLEPDQPTNPSNGTYNTVDDYCHFNPSECAVIRDDTHCQHNTRGKFCEECDVGYYGDATLPYEDACQSCPCPSAENK